MAYAKLEMLYGKFINQYLLYGLKCNLDFSIF